MGLRGTDMNDEALFRTWWGRLFLVLSIAAFAVGGMFFWMWVLNTGDSITDVVLSVIFTIVSGWIIFFVLCGLGAVACWIKDGEWP